MRHSVWHRLAAATVAGLAVASLAVSPRAGASAKSDYEQAKAELGRLGQEWNRLADQYSANANKLHTLEKNVAATEDKVDELRAVVEQKRANIGSQAISVYKYGSGQAGAALSYLVSPESEADISRASKYMDEVQGKTRDALNALHASEEDLDAELVSLNNKKSEQSQLVAELKSSGDAIKGRMAQQEEITAQHRKRLEAERAAAAEARRRAAAQAAAQRSAAKQSQSSSQSKSASASPSGSAGTGTGGGGSSGGASFGQGRLAPWAAAYGEMLRANYGGISSIGGWRSSGSVNGSDHPKGLAIDVMTSGASGDAIAARAASDIGSSWRVKYVIWNRRYYSGGGSSPYTGPSPHTDHVHISFY